MRFTSHPPALSLEPFAEIIRQHQSAVCAAAFSVTGDRALAEDIAQDTFLAAWHSLPTLRDPSKLGGWLRGIARNLARKARRKRRLATLEACADVAAGDDPARDAVARDDARLACAAMRRLPSRYREALVLYYWEDQSAKRVAESLGITEATVMQRLSRGRALLRAELERRIEGTLRRARPGTALTAAILAAVAATARTASAAGDGAPPRAGVSRRVIWKAGLTLAAVRVLGTLGAPFAALSRRRASGPRPAPATTTPRRPARDAATTSTVPDAAIPPTSPTAPQAPLLPDDEPNPCAESMSVTVTSDGAPAAWAGKLKSALSLCFVDELVDHPCRIEVEVRDGKIATTTVEPFDGASRRVVVRTLQDVPTALAPPDLVAWLAADKLIHAVRDAAELPDHDQAMPVGELVALCAKARLEGLPVPGPDGTRHLRFGWSRDPVKPVDGQAYLDLDVASGPSRGPASAPVTVVSFLDVAHPWGFGGRSLAAWSEVLARYPRDVRLVVKLCPQLPERALAIEAIHAAGGQGAFWPMLELVAASPERQALEDLVACATTLHLDPARFRADLEQRTFRGAVELDRDQMAAMDIDGLPSAIINGERFHGALPATACADAVERALRRLARRAG